MAIVMKKTLLLGARFSSIYSPALPAESGFTQHTKVKLSTQCLGDVSQGSAHPAHLPSNIWVVAHTHTHIPNLHSLIAF